MTVGAEDMMDIQRGVSPGVSGSMPWEAYELILFFSPLNTLPRTTPNPPPQLQLDYISGLVPPARSSSRPPTSAEIDAVIAAAMANAPPAPLSDYGGSDGEYPWSKSRCSFVLMVRSRESGSDTFNDQLTSGSCRSRWAGQSFRWKCELAFRKLPAIPY